MLKAALPITIRSPSSQALYFYVRPPWCGMSSYGSIVADLSSFNFSVLLILLLYLGFWLWRLPHETAIFPALQKLTHMLGQVKIKSLRLRAGVTRMFRRGSILQTFLRCAFSNVWPVCFAGAVLLADFAASFRLGRQMHTWPQGSAFNFDPTHKYMSTYPPVFHMWTFEWDKPLFSLCSPFF